MTQGFWGNYKKGVYFEIDEHETWIRKSGNAALLGVPEKIISRFGEFANRDALLPFLYRNAPVMRWRGHGAGITFEFNAENWTSPLALIKKWGENYAGPFLYFKMVNFRTMEVRAAL